MATSIAELLANNTPDSGMVHAGASIGSAATNNTQPYYDKGISQASRQAKLLEDARRKRDQNAGFEQVTPQAVEASGFDQKQAGLIAGLIHAGVDPQHLEGALQKAQSVTFGNQAMDAATANNPDMNLLQRINMVRSGKPVDLTKIEDHTVLNPAVTPDQQHNMQPTQVGLADMMFKKSQANAADARAVASNASAQRTRTLTPLEATLKKAQTSHSTASTHTPSVSEMGAVLGKTKTDGYTKVVDPKNIQELLGWMHDHPGSNISDYVVNGPVGAPGTLPPAGATSISDMASPENTPSAQPTATQGDSPYAEGTQLKGPDGRTYVVKGGVPVPVQ